MQEAPPSPCCRSSLRRRPQPPDVPPQGSWALGPRPLSPVGHVVEVLRELGQVGALLLVLLFCPKQNLRNLYLIEELGIQQCQLLGYFMAVKIMQGPRPGRQSEMSGAWTGRGSWAGPALWPPLRGRRAPCLALRLNRGHSVGWQLVGTRPGSSLGLPCRLPSPASAGGSCGPRLGPWTAQLREKPLPGPASGAWWAQRWCHVNEGYNTR